MFSDRCSPQTLSLPFPEAKLKTSLASLQLSALPTDAASAQARVIQGQLREGHVLGPQGECCLTFPFSLFLSRTLGDPVGRPARVGTEPPRPGQWAWAGAAAEDHPRPRDSHTAAAMATNKERLFATGALGPGSGYPGAGFPFAFPGALRGSPPFEMLSPSFRGLGQPDLPKEMASLCESQGSRGMRANG